MAYEAQIAKGVALLDEKVPGWLWLVDLDVLDMSVCETYDIGDCGCVLSQIDFKRRMDDGERGFYGNYPRLARTLGLDTRFQLRNAPPNHAEHFGFTLPLEALEAPRIEDIDEDRTDDSFDALTDEWKATILRLRAERAK